ncbi:hypothetical protein Goshw_010039 [Gossypium schwendimanii]|uniref:Cytokinin riboside 5'-monophosphate phosphoribohydrolase n=1 Tax=Gossypium schwendimanii TaxID=34291 RepID=A0A7J9MAP4_GOSSC|nr:hypothetical protein [Gossypium schwendimanii]
MEDEKARSKFKRLCVFCGSNSGHRQVFSDAALELGNELVKRKIDLVYGGGSVGLMGLISKTVYDGGCHVLGIIPKALMPLEVSVPASIYIHTHTHWLLNIGFWKILTDIRRNSWGSKNRFRHA